MQLVRVHIIRNENIGVMPYGESRDFKDPPLSLYTSLHVLLDMD